MSTLMMSLSLYVHVHNNKVVPKLFSYLGREILDFLIIKHISNYVTIIFHPDLVFFPFYTIPIMWPFSITRFVIATSGKNPFHEMNGDVGMAQWK